MIDRPISAEQGSCPKGVGSLRIRPYDPEDRAAIRSICQLTAYRNRGYQVAFEDGETFADYWTRYYTDFEPECALIAEVNGSIVGYLLGCANTRRHRRIMGLLIMPRLVVRILKRVVSGEYIQPVTMRMLQWTILNSWREGVSVPLVKYPAHYHCNIIPQATGLHLYTDMVCLFLDMMHARGVPGIHGTIEEPRFSGPWRRMVDRVKQEPQFYAEVPTCLHRDVFLDARRQWVLRVWGDTISNYRLFVDVAKSHFHI